MPVPYAQVRKNAALALRLVHDDLIALGFVYIHSVEVTGRYGANDSRKEYFHVYSHQEAPALAYVELAADLNSGTPVLVSFLSRRESGEILCTLNRRLHTCPGFGLGVLAEDALAQNLSDHWAYHVARLKGVRLVRSRRELVAACLKMYAHLTEDWAALGIIRPNKRLPGAFRIPLGQAARLATRMLKGQYRMRGRYRMESERDLRRESAAAESEMLNSFEASKATRRLKGWGPLLLVLGTGLLATFSFAGSMSWVWALALIVVIAIHEAGHFLAMRVTGYQDVRVFFIPFLGGATTGHKEQASVRDWLWVYLAGPALGLCVGLGVWVLDATWGIPGDRDFVFALIVLSFSINLFNLLPIVPLDGGRVLEVTLLSRVPQLQGVFMVLGCLVLGGLAFYWENYWLAGFVLLLLLAVPHHWRAGQLVQQVRQKMQSKGLRVLPRRTAINASYKSLLVESRTRLNAQQRVQAVQLAVPVLIRPPARASDMLFGLFLYGAVLCVPLGLGYYLLLEGYLTPARTPVVHTERIVDGAVDLPLTWAEIAPEDVLSDAQRQVVHQWSKPEERWAEAMKRAGAIPQDPDNTTEAEDEADPADMEGLAERKAQNLAYLKLAREEARAFSPGDPRRIQTEMAVIEVLPTEQALSAIIQLQTDLETVAVDEKWVSQVRLMRIERDAKLLPETALKWLRKMALYCQRPDSLAQGQWCEGAAYALFQRNEFSEAEKILAHLQQEIHKLTKNGPFDPFEHPLAWVRIQQGNLPKALEGLLERQDGGTGGLFGSQHNEDLAWVYTQMGQYDQAAQALAVRTPHSSSAYTFLFPPLPARRTLLMQLYVAQQAQDAAAQNRAIRQLKRQRRLQGGVLLTPERAMKEEKTRVWDSPRRKALQALEQTVQ